jgi:hypothetical protein
MMNDRIRSKVVPAQVTDDFKTRGMTFSIESNHETQDQKEL